ncbi:MAG: class A beta-lactamase-related serine hydrolase [Fimbriimonadaceae bacterium]|jgi:hypothetical protein|nr:class A beta-lactamase-related serine hydrolase [Fimbriimonadaceae bacterium]
MNQELDTLAQEGLQLIVRAGGTGALALEYRQMSNEGVVVHRGSVQARQAFYPASLVKVFYLVALYNEWELGTLERSHELVRAARDMIVESLNDATALILDCITDTTGGPELPPDELSKWMEKRQAVNRFFASQGYERVNACQKTWNEGPYGRERQGYGPHWSLRNSICAESALKLLVAIRDHQIVSPRACVEMWDTLIRPRLVANSPSRQGTDFLAKHLSPKATLWSKAGWTSEVRHDLAWMRAESGDELGICVLTSGISEQAEVIPSVGRLILGALRFPLQEID